jgi:hypothetical protein
MARVVEFLNAQMDPAEALAVEIRQFANETLQTLVPRLIGQTAEAQIKKGATQRQWDESSFFHELEQRRGEHEAAVCREIIQWAAQKNLKPSWGKGAKDGSFLLRFNFDGSTYHLISAWTYGRVEVQFQMLTDEPPFDDERKRLELLQRLNQIPGVSLGRDSIVRRPSVPLATLSTPGAVAQLCAAMEWVIEEASRVAKSRDITSRID